MKIGRVLLFCKGEKKMGIYEELVARGLIAQVTDEELKRPAKHSQNLTR